MKAFPIVTSFLLTTTTVAFVPSLLDSKTPQGTSLNRQQLYSSSDDSFMASLQRRLEEVREKDAILPIVVLDTMLPRQVLNVTVNNGLLMELIRDRLQEESPRIGMLGNARLADGRQITLSSGVEVEIVGKPKVTPAGLHVSFKGARRFQIQDEKHVEKTKEGWTQAKVKYLNSTLDDRVSLTSSSTCKDPVSIARAMQMAREFTDPNFSMAESQSLVNMWLTLARKKERKPNQIDQLLNDLGPMPSWKDPSECAFWVGALINPIPALGVAKEIRPKLLLAKTPEERTQIALDGIWNSIQHMQGANRFEQRKE
jgi:Lon protease-like protein